MMKIRASAMRGALRLVAPSSIKVKGLNVVHSQADGGWGAMWSNFNWDTWIRPQVDLAKSRGANLVKITGSGATVSYPAMSTFSERAIRFLDYTAQQGLLVYWNFASNDWGGSLAVATTKVKEVAALLDSFPHVVGLDVANEVNMFGALSAGDIPAMTAAARSATAIPLTASLSCSSAANFTDGTAGSVAPFVDFMDFHPYFGTGDPAPASWDAYRSWRDYKPWLIGECGQNLEAGASAQTSRWQALGAISQAAADCFGVIGFCVADYASDKKWGMYAADLVTVRSAIADNFVTWPAKHP